MSFCGEKRLTPHDIFRHLDSVERVDPQKSAFDLDCRWIVACSETTSVVYENHMTVDAALTNRFEFSHQRGVGRSPTRKSAGVVPVKPKQCRLTKPRQKSWQKIRAVAFQHPHVRIAGQSAGGAVRKTMVEFDGIYLLKGVLGPSYHLTKVGSRLNEYAQAMTPRIFKDAPLFDDMGRRDAYAMLVGPPIAGVAEIPNTRQNRFTQWRGKDCP